MSENTLHYADLDGRDATGSWHDTVGSEPLYVGDDTECPDPSVSSTFGAQRGARTHDPEIKSLLL